MAVEQAIINLALNRLQDVESKLDQLGVDLSGIQEGAAAAEVGAKAAKRAAEQSDLAAKNLERAVARAGSALSRLATATSFVERQVSNVTGEKSIGVASVVGATAEGASIGAVLGSFVPGIGTAVGAGIGASIGAIGETTKILREQDKEDIARRTAAKVAEHRMSEGEAAKRRNVVDLFFRDVDDSVR